MIRMYGWLADMLRFKKAIRSRCISFVRITLTDYVLKLNVLFDMQGVRS